MSRPAGAAVDEARLQRSRRPWTGVGAGSHEEGGGGAWWRGRSGGWMPAEECEGLVMGNGLRWALC